MTFDTCWYESASNPQTPTFHCGYYTNDNVTNCPNQINTVIMVYKAGAGDTCAEKTCVGGNDAHSSGRQCSKLTVPVEAGQQYLVAVGVYDLWDSVANSWRNNRGPFRLLMTSNQPCLL
jgi:hypothetical protein